MSDKSYAGFPGVDNTMLKLHDNGDGTFSPFSFGLLPQTTFRATVIPAITAGAYSAGKSLGGVMAFAGLLPASTLAGILHSITLRFKGSVQTQTFTVNLFDTSPTGTFADNVVTAIVAADSAFFFGSYTLNAPSSVLGTHTIYNLDGIGKALQGVTTSIYAVVVASGATAAPASTADMSLTLSVLQG